jgi:hypothetical protein
MSGTPGTITTGNLVLTNQNGSFNFLQALNTVSSISVLTTLFDKSFELSDAADDFERLLIGSGSGAAKDVDHVTLSVVGVGDRAVLQSRQYVPSQAGSTRIVMITASLGDPSAACTVRVGSFDDAADKIDGHGDGFYFEMTGGVLYACVRVSTYPSGEVKIPQSAFNLDKLDGDGVSRYTLDPATPTTFIIAHESRLGSVRLGIVAQGTVLYAHRFDPSASYGPVRATSLPIRYEILSLGDASDLRAYTASVGTSGAVPRGIKRTCGTGAASAEVAVASTSRPVVSVRMAQGFCRASVRVTGVRLRCTSGVLWELVLNGDPVDPIWRSTSASSVVSEIDTNSKSMASSDGVVVASGYTRGEDAISIDISDAPPLTASISGVSDVYTLNVVALVESCMVWGSLEVVEVL